MKTIYSHNKPMQVFKRAFILTLISLTLVQCKKDNSETALPKEEVTSVKTILLKDLAKELLSLGKDAAFVQFVYNECKVQKFGDYYVRVEDLLELPDHTKYISPGKEAAVAKILNDLKVAGARTPIIFYPSVETKEDRGVGFSGRVQTPAGSLIGVIDGGNHTYTNNQYPGYIFNTDGQLAYYQEITEEFAWNNDVWVIGEEENCSEGNMQNAPEELLLYPAVPRFQGQPEYGAAIQCTDLGSIESWVSGKLEFKVTEMNSSGGMILGPLALGKVKRKYFQDQKWYDYNKFIGNWHTSTFGNWMYEHWLEEDGGNSASLTINLPPPSGATGPSYSATIPSQNRDDNLGLTTIQFTDLISQVYNISYANIKHRN